MIYNGWIFPVINSGIADLSTNLFFAENPDQARLKNKTKFTSKKNRDHQKKTFLI